MRESFTMGESETGRIPVVVVILQQEFKQLQEQKAKPLDRTTLSESEQWGAFPQEPPSNYVSIFREAH